MSQAARTSREPDEQIEPDAIDCRETPQAFFDELNAEHRFTLDVCATHENAKCGRFFDRKLNGLLQPWAGHTAWCNPPFSNIRVWVAKALLETRVGCPKVVMLLPANRTEQGWWHDLIEPVRDRGLGVATRFVRGRLKFPGVKLAPHAEPPKKDRPKFGVVLVTFTMPGNLVALDACSFRPGGGGSADVAAPAR